MRLRARTWLTFGLLVVSVMLWCGGAPPQRVAGVLVLLAGQLIVARTKRVSTRRPPWSPPWSREVAVSSKQLNRPSRWKQRLPRLVKDARRIAAVVVEHVVVLPGRGVTRLLSHHARAQATTEPSLALPVLLGGLVPAIEGALQEHGDHWPVIAIESGRRSVTLVFDRPKTNADSTKQMRERVRSRFPSARWIDIHRLRLPLPLTQPIATGLENLWAPIMRRRGTTLWWPLSEWRPWIIAGECAATTRAILGALAGAIDLLYDPERSLGALLGADTSGLVHRPDALALACARSLRGAYARQRAPDGVLPPPLTLVVVAPDANVWQDLKLLLAQPHSGVRLILVLSTGVSHPAAQDACQLGSVVEVGAYGVVALPEACRPPGLAAPPPGHMLAWHSAHDWWRGSPIRHNRDFS